MSGVLEKLGFKEGATYTFNEDSTYTSVIGGKQSMELIATMQIPRN